METIACEGIKFMLKLFVRTTEEVNLVRGSDNESADLKVHLKTINENFEEAEKREITSDAFKIRLKDLDDVAFDANNVLDEINYDVLCRKIQTEYKIKPKRCLNIPCCTTLAFQWKMAHKIKDINAKFETNKIGADIRQFLHHPVPESTSQYGDPNLIGRETDESNILEMITNSINNVLSVLPIVGMGGLGKTALARKIFKHNHTRSHFNECIWVCVSANFDKATLFNKMQELLPNKDFQGTCIEAVLQKIKKELKDKRYLIVLDDLWNEEEDYWNALKNNLEEVSSNKGNVIIITTRSEKVASIVNTFSCPYSLRSLKEDQCWSIIRERAFQDKGEPKEFETMKEIASNCRGLPLAANVMGSALEEKREERRLNVQHNGLSNLEELWMQSKEKGVLQVLKLSYNRLRSSEKKCFAYCSIFIKDSVIYREDLIQLWMAVGLLPTNQESDGNTIFNDFLQKFFFQEHDKDEYGNIMSCKMHVFFHDLACLVSDDIFHVRHLAITSIGEETQDLEKKARHLLLLSSTSSVPDKILPHFKHLHVLKLSGAAIKELPNSIDGLKQLRYLDVSGNDRLTSLPESVCELFNLQTLRILYRRLNFQRLEKLPKDLQFLICLRHLCLNYVSDDFKMPPNIGSLTCLQKLPLFCVGKEEGCRIDELGKLKELKGTLKIQNLELVSGKTEAEKADMAGKLDIYELHFHWGVSTDGNTRHMNAIESNINDDKVLEGLMPHQNLKGLLIEGFRGKNFPVWTRNMEIYKGNGGPQVIFDELIKIEFTNCHECEEIPVLGHLPLLKYLRLDGLTSVTSIGSSFYGESDCSATSSNDGQETRVSFPSLESLKIAKMPNLTKWKEAQTSRMQVFHCLKVMEISHCDELRELPYGKGNLQSLEALEISYCRNLQSISYQNGQEGLRFPSERGNS